MKTIPIVFSTDDNYVLPTCVAMQSIKSHISSKIEVEIFILYDKLLEENKILLTNIQKKNFKVNLINISPYITNTKLYSVGYFSVAMFYRLFIPQILHNYEKALYLDCDILCTKNIFRIFEVNFENKKECVAAVECINVRNGLINSGVLLFNIKEWNKQKITEKCIEFINANQNLGYPDQDTIRAVCKDRIKLLHGEFNFQMSTCIYSDFAPPFDCKKKDIAAYHFGIKPWVYYNYPLANLWWKTAKNLPKEYYEMIISKYEKDLVLTESPNKFYKYYFAGKIKRMFIKIKDKLKRCKREKK